MFVSSTSAADAPLSIYMPEPKFEMLQFLIVVLNWLVYIPYELELFCPVTDLPMQSIVVLEAFPIQ